jgi:hypothetical protein
MVMKIVKHKHWNKKTKVIASVLLVTTVIAGYYMYAAAPFSQKSNLDNSEDVVNSVDYGPASDEQVDAGYEAKKQAIDPSHSSKPSNTDTQGPAITITSLNQDNGILSIRTTVDSTNAGGTCFLQMTKDGADPITQQVDLADYGSYSVCKGFDVPKTSLISGVWRVSISFENGNQKSSASKDVSI